MEDNKDRFKLELVIAAILIVLSASGNNVHDMMCNNCGKEQPGVVITLDRYRDDGGASHKEVWCLECVQGKKSLRDQYDVPVEWNR
jgi:hypothetical protein